MENLKQSMKSTKGFAIFLSVMMPVGIVGTVLSAINKLHWPLAISIIFIILGFYVMPILWANLSTQKFQAKVLQAIEDDKLETATKISAKLLSNNKEIAGAITTLIRKQYLSGYTFDGENITALEEGKLKQNVSSKKCPNCGAPVRQTKENPHCPYCGS